MLENKIINQLKSNFPIIGGIGDDAAILPLSATESYIITKDILVEDIHFRRSYVDPISLGIKALQVNLSDIAAMGGRPNYVFLGISIPKNYPQKYIDDFLQSFSQNCKDENIQLIGGDTTSSPDKLFISVTVIGTSHNPKLRSQARPGDIIAMIGNLGHSYLGLQAFEQNISVQEEFKQALLRPKALLKEGLMLGSNMAVTAMMDISDGLLTDLKKLCRASNMLGEINIDYLQNTASFNDGCSILKLDPLAVMLTGGEDYGLLITIAPEGYKDLSFKLPIINIGKIIDKKNGGEVSFNKQIDISLQEFLHFGGLNS